VRPLAVVCLLLAAPSEAWVTRLCPTNSSLRPSYPSNVVWPYVFLTNMPTGDVSRQRVENQMVAWNSIVGANDVMTVVSGSSSTCTQPAGVSRTTIGWDDGTCTSFGANTLAVTNVTTQGCVIVRQEVYFNSNWAFSTGEFLDTALHELGHAANAGHEWNAVAMMGYSDTPLLGLTADDHLFLRTLYPSGQTAAPDFFMTRIVLRNPVIPNVQSMVQSPAPTCSGGCSDLHAQDTISVRLTYGNAGSRGVSGSVPIEMRLGSHLIGTWTLSNYPAHAQDTFTFVATLPTGIPPGSYSLTVEVDPAGTVTQSNGPTTPDVVSFTGFTVRLPAGWTCASGRYGSNDGCDCGCGVVDPDCSSSSIAVRGCGDSNLCTDDRCNASAQCSYLNNTASCDDGTYCTVNDRCSGGTCVGGGARDCSAQTSTCSSGTCDEAGRACVRTAVNEGGACSDGLYCTVNDACSLGQCRGTARSCSALDGACTAGSCNEATDQCVAVPANEAASCDDGSRCTTTDVCRAGTCAGRAVDCSSLTQGCLRGQCDALTGQCVAVPAPDGTACDDGLFCTVSDVCRAGSCQAGTPRACASTACTAGSCDEQGDACVSTPTNEGLACDDGRFCTSSDTCRAGVCGGSPTDCSTLNGPCRQGVCDEGLRACRAMSANESGSCDDGNGCSESDRCVAGTCRGVPKACPVDPTSCVVASCDATTGQCATQPKANGAICSDGVRCTINDTCQSGTCRGTPLDCSRFATVCSTSQCVETTGTCGTTPLADGTRCDDQRPCTSGDTCVAGQCGGAQVDCSALTQGCLVGRCDGQSGRCVAEPVADGALCDDGSLCTEGDVCRAGTCTGVAKTCSRSSECVATCEPSTGACVTSGRCESAPKPGCGCTSGAELVWVALAVVARRLLVRRVHPAR